MFDAVVLVVFVLLQIADGALTYYGIIYTSLGMAYEANQLLASSFWWLKSYFIALIIAKGFSIVFGGVLYYFRDQIVFGLKVVVYLRILTVIMLAVFIAHIMTIGILECI